MRPIPRNTDFGVPAGSDTNQAVQPQEMVRFKEFHIYKVEGLYKLHVCTHIIALSLQSRAQENSSFNKSQWLT